MPASQTQTGQQHATETLEKCRHDMNFDGATRTLHGSEYKMGRADTRLPSVEQPAWTESRVMGEAIYNM